MLSQRGANGLLTQSGPWKHSEYKKPDEKIWVGGGIGAGGTSHAGHANWLEVMDPAQLSNTKRRAAAFPTPSRWAIPSVVQKKLKHEVVTSRKPSKMGGLGKKLDKIAETLQQQNLLAQQQAGYPLGEGPGSIPVENLVGTTDYGAAPPHPIKSELSTDVMDVDLENELKQNHLPPIPAPAGGFTPPIVAEVEDEFDESDDDVYYEAVANDAAEVKVEEEETNASLPVIEAAADGGAPLVRGTVEGPDHQQILAMLGAAPEPSVPSSPRRSQRISEKTDPEPLHISQKINNFRKKTKEVEKAVDDVSASTKPTVGGVRKSTRLAALTKQKTNLATLR
jgi:hypothetical protein